MFLHVFRLNSGREKCHGLKKKKRNTDGDGELEQLETVKRKWNIIQQVEGPASMGFSLYWTMEVCCKVTLMERSFYLNKSSEKRTY